MAKSKTHITVGKTHYNLLAFKGMTKEDFIKKFPKNAKSNLWSLIQKGLKDLSADEPKAEADSKKDSK